MASFKKFLTYTALTAAAVAGGIAIYKKFQGNSVDCDDDFDDFDDDDDDAADDEDRKHLEPAEVTRVPGVEKVFREMVPAVLPAGLLRTVLRISMGQVMPALFDVSHLGHQLYNTKIMYE